MDIDSPAFDATNSTLLARLLAQAGQFFHGFQPLKSYLNGVSRFYLHLCDEAGFCADHEGVELADLPAARAMAIKAVRAILAGSIRQGELNSATFIKIENEQREPVMLVSFEDAVRVTSTPLRERPSFQ